jgi:hypothetical protein
MTSPAGLLELGAAIHRRGIFIGTKRSVLYLHRAGQERDKPLGA